MARSISIRRVYPQIRLDRYSANTKDTTANEAGLKRSVSVTNTRLLTPRGCTCLHYKQLRGVTLENFKDMNSR